MTEPWLLRASIALSSSAETNFLKESLSWYSNKTTLMSFTKTSQDLSRPVKTRPGHNNGLKKAHNSMSPKGSKRVQKGSESRLFEIIRDWVLSWKPNETFSLGSCRGFLIHRLEFASSLFRWEFRRITKKRVNLFSNGSRWNFGQALG